MKNSNRAASVGIFMSETGTKWVFKEMVGKLRPEKARSLMTDKSHRKKENSVTPLHFLCM